MTPILSRPSDQPVSTNMRRSWRSCLVQDLTAFRGAGSADTAVLIEGICEGNLVVYLVTRTGRDLSLMTPSLPSSAGTLSQPLSTRASAGTYKDSERTLRVGLAP